MEGGITPCNGHGLNGSCYSTFPRQTFISSKALIKGVLGEKCSLFNVDHILNVEHRKGYSFHWKGLLPRLAWQKGPDYPRSALLLGPRICGQAPDSVVWCALDVTLIFE